MPDLLQIEGQARVLLIEPDSGRARQLLGTFSEAGLDCRYSPTGATGQSACQESHPHVVIIDETLNDADALILCNQLHNTQRIPVIVLTEGEETMAGHKYQGSVAISMPRSSNARQVLGAVETVLRNIYRYEMVLPVEEIPSNVKPAPPRGWGRCEACGYLGPRMKFESKDRSSAHSLTCPACKESGNVTFSVM